VGNAGQRPADRDELSGVIALSVVVARRSDRSLGRTVRVQPTNVPGAGRAEEPVGLGKVLGRKSAPERAHAHQFKRANRSLRKLKTYLGRVIRDIERQIVWNEDLRDALVRPLFLARRVLEQERRHRLKSSSSRPTISWQRRLWVWADSESTPRLLQVK
jgi:hypothetical protein